MRPSSPPRLPQLLTSKWGSPGRSSTATTPPRTRRIRPWARASSRSPADGGLGDAEGRLLSSSSRAARRDSTIERMRWRRWRQAARPRPSSCAISSGNVSAYSCRIYRRPSRTCRSFWAVPCADGGVLALEGRPVTSWRTAFGCHSDRIRAGTAMTPRTRTGSRAASPRGRTRPASCRRRRARSTGGRPARQVRGTAGAAGAAGAGPQPPPRRGWGQPPEAGPPRPHRAPPGPPRSARTGSRRICGRASSGSVQPRPRQHVVAPLVLVIDPQDVDCVGGGERGRPLDDHEVVVVLAAGLWDSEVVRSRHDDRVRPGRGPPLTTLL